MSFNLFLVLFASVVVVFLYIFLRLAKGGKEHEQEQRDHRAEFARRAQAKGRRYENVIGHKWDWKISGTAQGGADWTLRYSIAQRDVYPDGLNNPGGKEFDTIQGQMLEWRCPGLKRDAHAFAFFKRTGREKVPEVRPEGNDTVWIRWRLEARDEAAARRAFSPAVCALLEKLPPAHAKNTLEDERTSIVYGTDGLVSVKGAYFPEPDVVDLWIQINEEIAAALTS